MDLGAALASFGKGLLVTVGLAAYVATGFSPPREVTSLPGGPRVEFFLEDAVTEEMIPLVERSVEVRVDFEADVYLADGTRRKAGETRTLRFRSLDGRWRVEGGEGESLHRSLFDAEKALGHYVFSPGAVPVRSVVVRARLDIPALGDERLVSSLWGDRKPQVVWEPGR